MDENQDVGGSGFEERIRELFADGTADGVVSAGGVIDGARRRRVRHRATAAGSSLAVLGVAVGAIAFAGGNVGENAGAASGGAWIAKHSTPVPTGALAPKTCSASVTGTVPGTTTTTLDSLLFNTVSGTTAGIPWAVQIHVFPDKKSHIDWEDDKLPPGSIPQAAKDAEHPGAMAQFRTPGVQGYSEVGGPDGTSGDSQYFTIQEGRGIGTSTAAKTSQGSAPGQNPRVYTAYVTSGWMGPDVDHLCAQYADHAEFEPVYRIQGGDFYVFGYSAADRPQKVIGYSASGTVVGTATAVKGGQYFLLSLPGTK
ncbi:hypothetical protein [Catenulispora sp. EB89]|uniref:hypothetical protein n=1 Tax=Catenulispora sp. EB89 TaxID=3156257 RepID=UPI0035173809